MQEAVGQRAPLAPADGSRRVEPPAESASFGLSLTLFALLALIAIATARALAPALPGSATGIATWINLTTVVAACSSQLVAAGGVALCLRLLAGALLLPGLGVAFRMSIVPITLSVIALVVGGAAQPLEPDLSRALSILEIAAPACAAPLLLSRRRSRAVGLVLLLAAAGALFDLAAYEILRRADGPWVFSRIRATALFAIAFDTAAAALAFAWASGNSRRAAIGLALVISGLALAILLSRAGDPTASAWQVVLRRSLDALGRRPVPLLLTPPLASIPLLLPIVLGAVILGFRARSADLRAALTFCLIARVSTGAPAAALLGVGALLLAVPHALQEEPEGRVAKAPT